MGSADIGRTEKRQYPGWMVVRFHRPIGVGMAQETTPSPSYVPMPGTGRGACGPASNPVRQLKIGVIQWDDCPQRCPAPSAQPIS